MLLIGLFKTPAALYNHKPYEHTDQPELNMSETTRTTIEYSAANQPMYKHLEPIVDFLVANGNSLARDERWHTDMSAIVCYLNKPIDFEGIKQHFALSNDIVLNEEGNWIECAQTMCMIQGG